VDIQPPGIVLHGSLLLFDWPAPHVEFEQIPPNTSAVHAGGGGAVLTQGPDYSALKTWIPGGTISQYEWSVQGQEQAYPFDVDPNRFVLLHSGPQVLDTAAAGSTPLPGYAPLCLTITGSRISNYGTPIVYQPVSASVCGVTRFTVGGLVAAPGGASALPMFAVARPGPSGQIVVGGHASVEMDKTGASSPNLLVHFADSKSANHLHVLTQALKQCKRTDAPTAVIAVLTPDQVSKARFTPGVIYADDQDAWMSALRLKDVKPPVTLIMSPRGGLAWKHEGAMDAEGLQSALSKYLVKRGPVRVTLPQLNSRIGQPAPNFLFEYASGRDMPLSKLKGQELVLVFWKSSVKASIQAVRDLQNPEVRGKTKAAMVLAINDGDEPEMARAVAAENGVTATVVADPQREISAAYGVNMWPTIVTVNAAGIVGGIRYGHAPGTSKTAPSPTAAA
jgi:peroxiredoxin